jgi:hypothetical protein
MFSVQLREICIGAGPDSDGPTANDVAPFLSLCHWPRLEKIKLERVTATAAAALATGSVHWPALRELTLEGAKMDPAFFHALAAGSWSSLQTLDLYRGELENPAPDEIGEALADLLARLPSLQTLKLVSLFPTFEGDRQLYTLLRPSALRVTLPALETMNLRSSEVGSSVAELVADAAASGRWPNLRKVNVGLFPFGDEYDSIACSLTRISNLETLSLFHTNIGRDFGADNVMFRLAMLPQTLKILMLLRTRINNNSMLRVLGGDWRFDRLEKLWLAGNIVGEGGAALLAQASSEGRLPALEELWIGSLGPKGAETMFSVPWRRLKLIKIFSDRMKVPVGLAGAAAMGLAAAQNYLPSLRSLDLTSCSLNAEMVDLIFGQGAWPSLLDLNLSGNPLATRGCKILATNAHNLPAVRVMRLRECKFGDAGLAAILGPRTSKKWALDLVDMDIIDRFSSSPNLSNKAQRMWEGRVFESIQYMMVIRKVGGQDVPREPRGSRLPLVEGDLLAPFYND